MGRGDKKTAKGKRSMGSFGISRPKKKNTTSAPIAAPKKVKKAESANETVKVAVKKAPVKKAPAKKVVTKKKDTEAK
jgi:ribosomal small subunit protein bTHX